MDPITSNLFIAAWSACWAWHQRQQRTRQEQLGCQAGRPGSRLSCCWSAVLCHTGSVTSLTSGSPAWWMCLLLLRVCAGDGLRPSLVSYALITAAGMEVSVTAQAIPKGRQEFSSIAWITGQNWVWEITPILLYRENLPGKGPEGKLAVPNWPPSHSLESVQSTRLIESDGKADCSSSEHKCFHPNSYTLISGRI